MQEPISTPGPLARRGNPAMVKGGPSLNPNGRPKVGDSLASAMRRRFPPERIVELAEKLATTAKNEQVRLAALQLIAERAHGKVTDRHELVAAPRQEEDDEQLAEQLTDEEHDQLDALEAARAALLARAIRALPAGAE